MAMGEVVLKVLGRRPRCPSILGMYGRVSQS